MTDAKAAPKAAKATPKPAPAKADNTEALATLNQIDAIAAKLHYYEEIGRLTWAANQIKAAAMKAKGLL